MSWENVVMDQYDDSIPRARAGHCSVAVSLKKNASLVPFGLLVYWFICHKMDKVKGKKII